jgi:hypothetical protein
MKKQFLVTISDDRDNLSAVEFLCSFFKKESEHLLTLLHICRLDATDMNAALMEMWEKPDDRIKGQITIGARKALDRAIRLLDSSSMSIGEMATKTVAERFGKFRDILIEGERGLYDAIILGRRASYALQWLFERPADEIAQSIIRDSKFTVPLWVCPQTEMDRKHILLCVDGSENASRAADHVGYILSRQDQHNVTLLHVKMGSAPDSQKIFSRSETILHGHDISDARIESFSTWGLSVSGTILGLLKRQRYAAVALGLHGQAARGIKDFNLAGNTTSTLLAKIENTSLWCCP